MSSSPVKIEVKEENIAGNDYLMAKVRLQGALKQLTEKSGSDSDTSEDSKPRSKRTESRKRKAEAATYHHTYVMKLFDRSVDLAKFEEDTPLYPICRAWMANQPRNPQIVVKRRLSSQEPDHNLWNGDTLTDIYRLPPPSEPFVTRIPSPLPEQNQKTEINLNYDEQPPIPRDTLIRDHLQRWVKVKKKWIAKTQINDRRYAKSTEILEAIYNKCCNIKKVQGDFKRFTVEIHTFNKSPNQRLT